MAYSFNQPPPSFFLLLHHHHILFFLTSSSSIILLTNLLHLLLFLSFLTLLFSLPFHLVISFLTCTNPLPIPPRNFRKKCFHSRDSSITKFKRKSENNFDRIWKGMGWSKWLLIRIRKILRISDDNRTNNERGEKEREMEDL